MGGFAALLTGAARDDLRGVAGIAPYDFGKAYLAAMADPSGAQAYEQVMGCLLYTSRASETSTSSRLAR